MSRVKGWLTVAKIRAEIGIQITGSNGQNKDYWSTQISISFLAVFED
jgi:hypothetical protein